MRKKRSYQRDSGQLPLRDYTLFAIACEGSKTEPNYFRSMQGLSSRISIDIIEQIVSEEEALSINANKSAPNWVLDRAVRYIEKEGLGKEDQLWFVIDTDRWNEDQLRTIAKYCEKYPNWHVALSNPCFEVWLYLHKKSSMNLSGNVSCKRLKREIGSFDKGGYQAELYIPFLPEAIAHAKELDKHPDYFLPEKLSTKVYQLAEALLKTIGEKRFAFLVKQA